MKKRLVLGLLCLGITVTLPSVADEPIEDEAIEALNESFVDGQYYIEGIPAYTAYDIEHGEVHEAILKADKEDKAEEAPLEEEAYNTWRLVGLMTIYVRGNHNSCANHTSTASSEIFWNSFKPQYFISGDNQFGFQEIAEKKLKHTSLQAWGKMSQDKHIVRPYTNLDCETAHKVVVYKYEYLKKSWWGVKSYRAEVYGDAGTTTWFFEQAIKPDKKPK